MHNHVRLAEEKACFVFEHPNADADEAAAAANAQLAEDAAASSAPAAAAATSAAASSSSSSSLGAWPAQSAQPPPAVDNTRAIRLTFELRGPVRRSRAVRRRAFSAVTACASIAEAAPPNPDVPRHSVVVV